MLCVRVCVCVCVCVFVSAYLYVVCASVCIFKVCIDMHISLDCGVHYLGSVVK